MNVTPRQFREALGKKLQAIRLASHPDKTRHVNTHVQAAQNWILAALQNVVKTTATYSEEYRVFFFKHFHKE
eukprot:363613-Rhodomonas_salina.1